MFRPSCTAVSLSVVALLAASPASAGDVPLFNPAPDWVVGSGPIPPEAAKAEGIIMLDRQLKIDGDTVVTYTDVAIKATSAEQLANLGTLSRNWHPDKGDLIVHGVEIIRPTETVDVLKNGGKFTVLRREQNLEQYWIDGILTATMQVSGIKIGDILRVRISETFADPALAGNVETAQALIMEPVKIGAGSLRIVWPHEKALKWKISTPGIEPQLRKLGKFVELTIAQPLPKQPEKPKSAPPRFVPPDLFQLTSFSTWRDVSKAASPHYATDGLIAPGSQLAERVAKIAAISPDKLLRAAAALRLVQDEIRYLFNGQTQGNYVPQKPVDTWERRYGDCKAKTLLLIAILRSLEIDAEPALVHSSLGDLIPSKLPSFGAFNHVIARAVIGGKTYWLDGTELGTRGADLADTPLFHSALPLRPDGSDLETIAYSPPARPMITVDRDIDASAGLGLPTLYTMRITIRDSSIARLRQAQSMLAGKKLNEVIDKIVAEYMSESIITKRALVFDDAAGTATITAEGIGSLYWEREGDRRKAEFETIFSGFDLDFDRNRPAWKDIPVTTDAPNFLQLNYRLRLPNQGNGFALENPKNIDGRFGAYQMNVKSRLSGDLFEIMSMWKADALEMPAATLPAEREKIARVNAGEMSIIASADYPASWRENRYAYAAGRLKRLLAAYSDNIAQDPENADAYSSRAEFFADVGDYAAAIADVTKMLALHPDEATYLWRARLYRNTDPKKALADIEEARTINPSLSLAAEQAVDIYVQQRRFDEALAVVDEALPLQKDRSILLVEKSEILALAGRREEALAIMNKANQEKPGNSILLNGRCWVRALAAVELESALKDCTKAIELAEYSAPILDSRGLVYLRLQRYEDAIADFDAALRTNPGLPSSLFARGVARTFLGLATLAKQDIADARVLKPDVEEDYLRIGVKPKS